MGNFRPDIDLQRDPSVRGVKEARLQVQVARIEVKQKFRNWSSFHALVVKNKKKLPRIFLGLIYQYIKFQTCSSKELKQC
jgi:hypothetical protein